MPKKVRKVAVISRNEGDVNEDDDENDDEDREEEEEREDDESSDSTFRRRLYSHEKAGMSSDAGEGKGPWWTNVFKPEVEEGTADNGSDNDKHDSKKVVVREGGGKVYFRKVPTFATVDEVTGLVSASLMEFGVDILRQRQNRSVKLSEIVLRETFRWLSRLSRNGAKWMDNNSKLTRLKFRGGLKIVLGLDLSFEQFEGLWRRVQSSHASENRSVISWQQYRATFLPQDLASSSDANIGRAKENGDQEAIDALVVALAEFEQCGISFADAFDAFDRDASGAISISEFLSLMKLVGNSGLTKKEMFRLATSMDRGFDRSISKDAFLDFVLVALWKRLGQIREAIMAQGKGRAKG